MPIKGRKASKQRAIRSPQTSGRTVRGALSGRAHDLQDPANRRMIRADENLRPVLDGNDRVSMFEMTAYVSRHLLK